MKLYATKFQLVMVQSRVVRLGDDDYGLYGKLFRNSFGTPLMARGTRAEIEALQNG